MESLSPRSSLVPWLLGVSGLTIMGAIVSWQYHLARPPVTLEEVPERFTELLLLQEAVGDPSVELEKPWEDLPSASLPAIGPPMPQAEDKKQESMKSLTPEEKGDIMRKSLLLQQIGTRGANSGDLQGIGGLIGAKGGGLGTRGVGLGGGGTFGAAPDRAIANNAGVLGQLRDTTRQQQFVDHGVNPFTVADSDRFSTFSIDVDTASYSISRAELQRGRLPAVAGVRAEEFLNSFDYGYAPPGATATAPFRVHLEGMPHPFTQGRTLVRVGVKGAEPDTARTPLHLTFLVDVSGSMSSPDKLPLAKKSLAALVEQLDERDTVALVTYAGNTRVVLPPTSAAQAAVIHMAIDRLSSGGGTAMGSGMELAYAQASASYVAGEENRVVVLSDGDANIGPSGHTALLGSIEGYAKQGISMTTVGFGRGNLQDHTMEQLADKGDGNYVYIDSGEEARRTFVEKMGSTLTTIARDVKLQVEFNPAVVESYRLVGYENRDIADRDFRNDKVDAGEVGRGHEVTALYEVVLADRVEGELATVRVRAKPPGPDAPASEWLTRLSSDQLRAEPMAASRATRLALASATFAEKLRQSPHVGDVSWEGLHAWTEQAIDPRVRHEAELLELVETAAQLSGDRVALR